VFGRTSLSEDPAVLAEAAAVLAAAGARFLPALPRGNVMGALDMGLAPGMLPGRVELSAGRSFFAEAWGGSLPSAPGKDTTAMLEAAAAGVITTLVLLGADPLADFPDRDLATRALERANVIAVDTFPTASTAGAAVVLPAAGFGEVDGTTTNLEGRVLPLRQKVTPPGTARPDWMIAGELAVRLGGDLGFGSVAEVRVEIEALASSHAGLTDAALAGSAGGLVAAGTGGGGRPAVVGMPQIAPAVAVAVDDAALRLVVGRKMYDGATGTDNCPSLRELSPPNEVRLHPLDFESLAVGEGTVVTLVSARGRLDLPVVADDGVVRGAAAVLANVPDATVNHLLSSSSPVTDVRLEVAR